MPSTSDQKWRSEPVGYKQKAMLKRIGVEAEGKTKGEAAEIIGMFYRNVDQKILGENGMSKVEVRVVGKMPDAFYEELRMLMKKHLI